MDLRRCCIKLLSIFLRLWTAFLCVLKPNSRIPQPLEFTLRLVFGNEPLAILEFLSDVYSSYGVFAYDKIIYVTNPTMARKGMDVFDTLFYGAIRKNSGDISTDSRRIAAAFLRRTNVESKSRLMTKVIEKTMKKLHDSTACNISVLMLKMAIDIHGQVLLGLDLGALDDQQEALIETLSTLTRRTFVFQKTSPTSQEFRRAAGTLANLCAQMLCRSQEECDDTNTLAHQLQVCGSEEARLRLQVLLIAGIPVLATSLSMMLHLLAGKAVLQRELRQEADEWIEKMKHSVTSRPPKLESAIKEFLRCYPVTAFVGCKANDDLQVEQVTIKRGSDVRIFIWGMHRSPKLWTNAKQYSYDRFMQTRQSTESTVQSDQCPWMPFADGCRTCIGQQVAFYGLMLGLAFLLRHFTFYPVVKTKEPKICMDWIHGVCHLESEVILGIQRR